MSKVVAIIQARLTSTRLPRKVLKKIGNKTMLQHVIDKVNKSKLIDTVVVASPTKIPFKRAFSYIFAKEHEVLERYYFSALAYKATIIVRITSDCPCVDPEVIDIAIKYFKKHKFPYVYFAPVDGLDVEVFSFKLLEEANEYALSASDREHVTPYMKRITKLSVDTKEDLERVRHVLSR